MKITVQRMCNAKAALIGFLAGREMKAPAIAGWLREGTTEGEIQRMLKPLPRAPGRPVPPVVITLTEHQRRLLARRAAAVGLSPDDWLALIVERAAAEDLYDTIIDERTFDDECHVATAPGRQDADSSLRAVGSATLD
jgi:hypothetical protein